MRAARTYHSYARSETCGLQDSMEAMSHRRCLWGLLGRSQYPDWSARVASEPGSEGTRHPKTLVLQDLSCGVGVLFQPYQHPINIFCRHREVDYIKPV